MGRTLKWLLVLPFVLLALISIVTVIGLLSGPHVPHTGNLRVVVDGPFQATPNSSVEDFFERRKRVSVQDVTGKIRLAAEDEHVTGLLLDIRNGSIGFAQAEELEEAMAVFRESGKPSFAFVETLGELQPGNSAYAVAIAAEHVTMPPSGDVNLAGLTVTYPFLQGTFDKLKMQPYFDRRHEYKTAVNMFTQKEFTQAHKESVKWLVDDLQDRFVQRIATRRNISTDTALTWLRAGPRLADTALEQGMLDQLGYWDQLLTLIEEKTQQDEFIPLDKYEPSPKHRNDDKTLAIIYGAGTIMRGKSDGEEQMGSDTLVKAIRKARKEKVDGILFRVDSPGGSYLASDLIRRELQVCRDKGIPVVVSMGRMAASGGYFVSLPGDLLVANPSTLTGSIGVYGGLFAMREFWNHWLGITFDSYQSLPDGFESFDSLDPPSEAQRERLGEFLDAIYADFTGKVGEARELDATALETLARGRVWTGYQALNHKLVDKLGGFQTAIAELKKLVGIDTKDVVPVLIFPKPKTPFESLLDFLGYSAQTLGALNRTRLSAEALLTESKGWMQAPQLRVF